MSTSGPVPAVAREINGERAVLLGWPCAILMQIAHPLIAAGVRDHSTFRDDAFAPIRRLHATVRAMLGLTFGDAAARDLVLGHIRDIHTRVHGRLRQTVGPWPEGTPYSAEDPELVLWVHATMLDTTVRVYEQVVRPLTPLERDTYCEESAPIAEGLGAATADVPRNWSELSALVERTLSLMVAGGPDALGLSAALLRSPTLRSTGPGAAITRSLTALWLPPSLREPYGFGWSLADERRARRFAGAVRVARRFSPRVFARWNPAPAGHAAG